MAIPLSLIPVNLKESALDSPTFRANAVHFCEQVDAVEKWLEAYVRSMLKVCQEVGGLEEALATNFALSLPTLVSESMLDQDYSLLAVELFAEAGREFWSVAIAYSKRLQPQMIDPLTGFLRNDVRQFKECRRTFETAQQRYDILLQRYAGQSKGKEASALREDAFQLHESRKMYIRSSFDFCVKAPELRASLDRIVTRVTTDLWREQVRYRRGFSLSLDLYESKMDRIRCWSDAMEDSAKIFKQELAMARRDMEEQARLVSKPSRELDDYSSSTVPFLTTRGKESVGPVAKDGEVSEKQGWLFIRSSTGKQGARSTWTRRWCFVKDGIFGSLVLQGQGAKGSGVEETEKIGLLLCNVKPAFQEDRRFCFEIKTKDISIILQAETQQELTTWLQVFEAAKRAAVLSSSSTTTSVSAFAISPPSAEFASPQTLRLEEIEKANTLNISNLEPVMRASTELGKRALVVSDDISPPVQSSRLGQILDMPSRRNVNASQGLSSERKSLPGGGGIQALISASHGALPLNAVPATAISPMISPSALPNISNLQKTGPLLEAGISSLAPRTLVSLPMSTSLSKQAVAASAVSDYSSTLPGGLMANSWGTSNWGISGRQDEYAIRPLDTSSAKEKIILASPTSPPADSIYSHRKAMSLDLETQSPAVPLPQSSAKIDYYPRNYPDELRQHDAQFRILFSEVPREEILLLVFRATWKPNDAQEFPGRVFVTYNAMYFYSHYLGLVLVNKIRLQFITSVRATPGKASDQLHLHLKEAEELGPLSDEDIAVTTFLEPIWLLQKRLRYLVSLAGLEEPTPLYQIVESLTKMENEPQQSPTSDSWEEISMGEGVEERLPNPSPSFQGTSMRHLVEKATGLKSPDFQSQISPVKPVTIVPPAGTSQYFTETYPLSAKSLFCLVFGDKSQVFPGFYSKRRSSELLCGPWVRSSGYIGRRIFAYTNRKGIPSNTQDSQIIQALEDNRYYMVLDRKTPWMVPASQSLLLETTIAIAQVSKNTASISLWIGIKWLKEPKFWKDTISNHAIQVLRDDTQDLASIISNEVNKAGPNSKLYKITNQYGQVSITNDSDGTRLSQMVPHGPPSAIMPDFTYSGFLIRGLTAMAIQCAKVTSRGVTFAIHRILKFVQVNLILLVLLGISIALNLVVSTGTIKDLWHDKAALSYIGKIGVVQTNTMKRSITIQEIELVTQLGMPRFNAVDGPWYDLVFTPKSNFISFTNG
ncbi:SNF1-interacting protein, variant 2 [Orbilia ellipsospora]|uniref:SNF1-interacting protein, variant 2 n=1 Tax=Orbilia ellipsospora TaxID=2528407 RepID=A0AAV9XJE4_9PEZI